MIHYKYCSSYDEQCMGEIRIFRDVNPLEMEIEANGWTFHTIVGKHQYGNYLCIPNWSIGSELAYLCDEHWNCERLCNYTSLSRDHAIAIACALAEVNRWMARRTGKEKSKYEYSIAVK